MTDRADEPHAPPKPPCSGALAVEPDPILQAVVEATARGLDAPVALVSLALPTIQFFRAHHGLPGDLAAMPAMDRRDLPSQVVVRTGAPVLVDDFESADRIPRAWSEQHGLRAYMGVPLRLGRQVVGTLEVLDRRPRAWTPADRRRLTTLADRAEARLRALDDDAHGEPDASGANGSARPLAELEGALRRARTRTLAARHATADDPRAGAAHRLLHEAVDVIDDLLDALDTARGDAGSSACTVHGVADAVTDATRALTASIGDVRWTLPDRPYTVGLPSTVANAVVSTVLITLATRLISRGARDPIDAAVQATGDGIRFVFGSASLRPDDTLTARDAMVRLHADVPGMGVEAGEQTVCLRLPIAI